MFEKVVEKPEARLDTWLAEAVKRCQSYFLTPSSSFASRGGTRPSMNSGGTRRPGAFLTSVPGRPDPPEFLR